MKLTRFEGLDMFTGRLQTVCLMRFNDLTHGSVYGLDFWSTQETLVDQIDPINPVGTNIYPNIQIDLY